MNEKPIQLSVIIPAYNEEKFIAKCISSILEQNTSFQFEVIVVDNKSKDKTFEIASKFDVSVVSENKSGASATRNTGAKLAKSNILYFVDADCRVPQGVLEKIIKSFQSNKSLNLISGPYVYDQDGIIPKFFTDKLKYFFIYFKLLKLFYGVSSCQGGNLSIRKSVFNKVNGFDETINNQEVVMPDDLDLAIRLHNAGLGDMLFSEEYKVFSSFRRVKKSPIRHTLIRFFASISMLRNMR